jgi:hypothetical protein
MFLFLTHLTSTILYHFPPNTTPYHITRVLRHAMSPSSSPTSPSSSLAPTNQTHPFTHPTATDLNNPVSYTSKVPSASTWAPAFVTAIDAHVAHLRLNDNLPEAFPNNSSDLEIRTKRRKFLARYTSIIEVALKTYVRETLGDVFRAWSVEQTRAFNKGVDKALTGVQWIVYPYVNVVVEAGEGNWGAWIRKECEGLGMERVRNGRGVLERT